MRRNDVTTQHIASSAAARWEKVPEGRMRVMLRARDVKSPRVKPEGDGRSAFYFNDLGNSPDCQSPRPKPSGSRKSALQPPGASETGVTMTTP